MQPPSNIATALWQLSVELPVITEEYLQSVLGRKYRGELQRLGTYTRLWQCIYPRKLVYKPISSHSTGYQKYLGNSSEKTKQPLLSKTLRQLCDLGILVRCSDEYHYHSAEETQCHCYFFNCNRGKEFLAYLKVNHPKFYPTLGKRDAVATECVTKSLPDFDIDISTVQDSVKITSKTRKQISGKDALIGLLQHYPYLEEFMSRAQQINEQIDNLGYSPWGHISYYPRFTRSASGAITKISIRATSSLCNKPKRTADDQYRCCREDILDEELGTWQEYDVRSSVPRVTYLLNHGVWLENDLDIYGLMFGNFANEDERKMYKQIFMYLYFSPTKTAAITSACKAYPHFTREEMAELYDKMVGVIGPSYGSEIFLHESNIYILVREMLLKQKIECLQVYDAFFMNTDIDVYKLISDAAQNYHSKLA